MSNVIELLSKVKHPEINNSLVELRMIGDVKEESGKTTVELKVPFLEIPIKATLIDSIKNALSEIGKIEVVVSVMSPEEKENFMEMAKKNWIV